ncbi:MAG: glycosyltransferase family 2 protein [Nitrospira sp. CG24E]|nr:MAG: glycosyltransferase family 2 protein [Nitrospira sp. CG24E]
MTRTDTQCPMFPTFDLSIAIVSYNTKEVLLDCLRSVHAHTTAIAYEVIVVDNDSRDGTLAVLKDAYPAMRVIENSDNRGFAKAVNQALAVSRGRHILLLNSDTIIRDQALATMVAYLDDQPDVGAVSCKQWTEDGHLNQTCFPFPSIRDHLFYSALFQRIAPSMQAATAATQAVDCMQSQDVDWANGACLMVRRSLLQELGGLDEGFFMYFEDADLCRRLRLQGYRVHHLAEVEIVHLIGRSSGRDRDRLQLVWEFSRIHYIEKHFSPVKRRLMKGWIAAGTGWRLMQSMKCASVEQRRRRIQGCLTTIRRLWRGPQSSEQALVYSSGGQG